MQLKPGTRLQSQACDTQAIVVRAPAGDVDVRCGGHPMVTVGTTVEASSATEGFAEPTLMGKRYADDAVGIELLCTKAGASTLSIGGVALPLKDAKPLPASD